jgi:hypothetical protein
MSPFYSGHEHRQAGTGIDCRGAPCNFVSQRTFNRPSYLKSVQDFLNWLFPEGRAATERGAAETSSWAALAQPAGAAAKPGASAGANDKIGVEALNMLFPEGVPQPVKPRPPRPPDGSFLWPRKSREADEGGPVRRQNFELRPGRPALPIFNSARAERCCRFTIWQPVAPSCK